MKITLRSLITLLISCATFVASAQSTLPFNHPKDQIALQLGAIQMGYTVPFQLMSGNATKAQQAANALVMGRNALDATVAKPAAKVQGFVSSPAVDTVLDDGTTLVRNIGVLENGMILFIDPPSALFIAAAIGPGSGLPVT